MDAPSDKPLGCPTLRSGAPELNSLAYTGASIIALFIGLWLINFAIGAITLRMLWQKSAAYSSTILRVGIRSFWFALFFTPAIAVCGALAIVPFPAVVLAELYFPASSYCGPYTLPNLRFVSAVWLVSFSILITFNLWQRKMQPVISNEV